MRLLLDSHLPEALALQLRRHCVDVETLSQWMGGVYRDEADHRILAAAHFDRRVLVSYDVGTIPSLLGTLAAMGAHHGGVILVSRRTFRPDDVGGLLRALLRCVERWGGEEWVDQVRFLRPD